MSIERFEAVTFVAPDGSLADLLAPVAELRALGVHVGAIVGKPGAVARALPPADGATGVLVLSDPRGADVVTFDGSGLPVRAELEPVDAQRAILGVLWTRGIAADAVLTLDPATPGEALAAALQGQINARMAGHLPGAVYERGWGLVREPFHLELDASIAPLFVLADGHIGLSGAPLGDAAAVNRLLLTGGVYTGDGSETHLLPGPVPWHVPVAVPDDAALRRVLDLRAGVIHEHLRLPAGGYRSARFCSLARPGTAVLRIECDAACKDSAPLVAPDDPGLALDDGHDGDVVWMRIAGTSGGIAAAASRRHHPSEGSGTVVVADSIAAYATDVGEPPHPSPAVHDVARAAAAGFDALLNEHRRAWSRRWDDADVVIEGDDELQTATRFALFHLMAAAGENGETCVGARGLTGPSYRGHVFWDADTFVLPFLAATHPRAARAMLEYRVRRLPVAMDAARRMGRAGARFPWESAGSGEDVTPPSARDRTGQVVVIRTGQLEDHIVGQVAWAASFYVDWTGDEDFARGPGLRLLVETARYWASRARIEADGSAHIYGVIGPDEYHEPVDDNTFTNVLARWNLRRALAEIEDRPLADEVTTAERHHWRRVADALVDGFNPDTGIYEQFAGFYGLEPLLIEEVAPRRPIAADLLLGRDRVGASQVIKQADVLMLHHLVPEAVEPDSLEPNLRYYEPRTAHGSSLSPAIHAGLFARARDFDRALPALRIASTIDLQDLTGSTAGGLHLATMGGLWQALAFGFAGMRAGDGALQLDPRLPPTWHGLQLHVRFQGRRVCARIEASELEVIADEPITVAVAGERTSVGPAGHVFRRRGASREMLP